MTMSAPPAGTVSRAVQHDATAQHLRGSSLLLIGRLLALVLSFAVQVATVRYLSKSDYGAYAYALSIIALGSSIAVFGLDKSMTRFVPIYHEERDYDRVFGTVLMIAGTVLGIGLALVLLIFALQGWIGHAFIRDPLALRLLLLLIVLSPVRALDCLVSGMFAVFASPRAIFFPRHLLGPCLQLAAMLLLMLGHANVYQLAAGCLATDLLGTMIYAALLFCVLRRQGILRHVNLRTLKMPARAVFSFTIPLLTSDLVFMLRSSLVVVLLEYFHDTIHVAAFRAVLPIARLNMVVFQSFMLLFMPVAARMYARNDREGINRLYWQTAIWIALLSFPLFAVTFSLAHPLTLLLYGRRYEQSAILLALLSFAHYFDAALGFNGLTLRVYGKVRYLVTVDLVGAVVGLAVNLLLIARYGALGAAFGTCATLVVQNLLYQAGLRRGTGISSFEWRYLKIYLLIAAGALALLLFQYLASPPLFVSFAAALVVSALVVGCNGKLLNVDQTFPELLRFPLARRIFGG
jgi:O-antigen/teichoic acid export membrane protein